MVPILSFGVVGVTSITSSRPWASHPSLLGGQRAHTHTHTQRERERERENEEQMCSQFSGYVPFEKFVTIRVACRT